MFEENRAIKIEGEFREVLGNCKTLMSKLLDCDPYSMKPIIGSRLPDSAVYAFFDRNTELCKYVGRTNNLSNRLRGHKSKSTSSASLAVKLARAKSSKPSNYKPGNSAKFLVENDCDFKIHFEESLDEIKGYSFRFVKVEGDIEQYFFELFATRYFKLSEVSFGTH